jgi:cohesin complex subunit SCC1
LKYLKLFIIAHNFHQASRRAAASFFFELLVLGTRDCVKLEQSGSFKDIGIQGKPKLWQMQQKHAAMEV